jgi:hypothetical protein
LGLRMAGGDDREGALRCPPRIEKLVVFPVELARRIVGNVQDLNAVLRLGGGRASEGEAKSPARMLPRRYPPCIIL